MFECGDPAYDLNPDCSQLAAKIPSWGRAFLSARLL